MPVKSRTSPSSYVSLVGIFSISMSVSVFAVGVVPPELLLSPVPAHEARHIVNVRIEAKIIAKIDFFISLPS